MEGGIDRLAGERGGGEGQWGFGGTAGGGEADVVDADGAEGGDVEAEGVEVCEGFAAEELAADLVAGFGFALDEGDATALASESDGRGAAGDAAAEDEDVVL